MGNYRMDHAPTSLIRYNLVKPMKQLWDRVAGPSTYMLDR